MKYVLLLTFTLLFVTVRVFAQSDTMTIHPPGIPAGQDGTPRVPDHQIQEQKEHRMEIQAASLPPAMHNQLEKNTKYDGWEDATIYYERNTDQYLLNIVRPNSTETFRFDKNGEPIETEKAIPGRETQH